MSNSLVACTWERSRTGTPLGAEEVLTLAGDVAAALGLDLNWVVAGPAPERMLEIAAQYGVRSLDRIEHPRLADFQADCYVEALAQHLGQQTPKLILLPQTFDGRLIAPRLAARIAAGVVMNALKVAVEGAAIKVTTSAYGGDTRVVYEVTGAEACVVGVLTDRLEARAPAAGTSAPAVRQIAVNLDAVAERVRVVKKAQFEGPRLEEAQIIVAGGMGLGQKENYHLVEDLARSLGGMAAASRPLVENGWVDSSVQVGLTGKATRPMLYIAAGISGASQHMAGCSAAKTIVAINTDRDAAIFRYARYGIVGNCLEVLPELTGAVKER